MLLQFKFKNYKCFYDETILDLTATKEKQHSNKTITINGFKILPIIEIHGANASGKSSVLEALQFMINNIKKSNLVDVNDKLYTSPFAFSKKSLNENSEFEISFVLDNFEYRYGFSLNQDGYDEEWLYKKKFMINSCSKEKLIFIRDKKHIVFNKSYEKYNKTWQLFQNTISNYQKLLILSSVAIKEEKGLFREIYNYLNKIVFKIERIFNQNIIINILKENNKLYNQFQKLITEFDPCLLGLKIDEKINEIGEKVYNIKGVHKDIDNNDCRLIPFQYESDGTIKMFNILPIILENLNNGGVLCIDELDVKFHPLLFKKIVNMYKDKSINKNNAQLIYTAHSTFLLSSDYLRRDEIYLVAKNNMGKSDLYSLSEFKNLRIDANYEKKYLTGQFGAIPFDDE